MSENRDLPYIVAWVVMLAALTLGVCLVLVPVAAHLAWDVFVYFWNRV